MCAVNVRTGPHKTSRIKAIIKTGTRVTAVARVTGGAWRARCGSKTVSGRSWYRITAINGRSVKARYGVRYLYAAAGLFRSAPTPVPATTPTPTPTGTAVTCDATFTTLPSMTTDQSSLIANFLSTNVGKRVCLGSGATYRVDARIQLSGWTGTIYGRGATLKRVSTTSGLDAVLRFVQGHDITIDSLNVAGPATAADVTGWTSWAREGEHALYIDSGARITVTGGSFTHTWGDGIYLAARDNCSGNFCGAPDTITLRGFSATTNGRNSVSITDGRNIALSDCHSDLTGLTGLDNEPNAAGDTIANISVRRCAFSRFNAGHTPSSSGNGYAIYASAGQAPTVGMVIDSNTFDIGQIYVIAPTGTRNSGLTVTNNSARAPGELTVGRTDGLTVSGNSNITHNSVYP